jgi:hypothetical protein
MTEVELTWKITRQTTTVNVTLVVGGLWWHWSAARNYFLTECRRAVYVWWLELIIKLLFIEFYLTTNTRTYLYVLKMGRLITD